MNKSVLAIIILLALGALVFYLASISDAGITGNVISDNPQEEVKTFVVASAHLRFYVDGVENPDIVVKQGDKVRIEFTSEEGYHDWVVDEFFAATEKVRPGNSTSVEFIANKVGNFKYYCSVGQHRANGMEGNFIVE